MTSQNFHFSPISRKTRSTTAIQVTAKYEQQKVVANYKIETPWRSTISAVTNFEAIIIGSAVIKLLLYLLLGFF